MATDASSSSRSRFHVKAAPRESEALRDGAGPEQPRAAHPARFLLRLPNVRLRFRIAFGKLRRLSIADNTIVNTPDRTTAAAFPRYAAGAGRQRLPPMAGPLCAALSVSTRGGSLPRACHSEPLISCGLAGSAEFRERELGEAWVTRQIGRGDIFVTRSKTPYEVRHSSRVGEELEIIQVHVAVDHCLSLWKQCIRVWVTKWT
jgi:hypothetical protein